MLLPSSSIHRPAWDACVARWGLGLPYGYTWYLNAVTATPGRKWVGVIKTDERGAYEAVLPVPLRRKYGRWVVHQPLFAPYFRVYGNPNYEAELIAEAIRRFRFGSVWQLQIQTTQWPGAETATCTNYLLDLQRDYAEIYRGYTSDRRRNLRLSKAWQWQTQTSTDVEPLIGLFRAHHAATIGVADAAYAVLRNLWAELSERGLGHLYYCCHNGRIEAGALFLKTSTRLIYLFNAATPTGRHGNARTWLLDTVIRENANMPMVLDFESPENPNIAGFYKSFGARPDLYVSVRWNRLTKAEKWLLGLKRLFAELQRLAQVFRIAQVHHH